jgi:hypothetical protein
MGFEEILKAIKEELPWLDEDVIGCSLSNYNDPSICSARNASCKNLVFCEQVQESYKRLKER